MGEASDRQRMLDEDLLYRLEIEFPRQVHDREILVVKFLLLAGLCHIAFDQVPVKRAMCVHMAIEIHGDESRKLHEAGIDEPPVTWMHERNFRNGIAPE